MWPGCLAASFSSSAYKTLPTRAYGRVSFAIFVLSEATYTLRDEILVENLLDDGLAHDDTGRVTNPATSG